MNWVKQKAKDREDKLDGSELSMIPILSKYAEEFFEQKSTPNLKKIEEFSVGQGIADLYIVSQHLGNYKKRKKLAINASISLHIGEEIKNQIRPLNVIENSVAIEAKVCNWRKGLLQAMRYQSFANKSYLAVYDRHINAPKSHIAIFKTFNIGLIGVSSEGIKIYFNPRAKSPNADKSLLASERVYSIIDDTQNSFVARNSFAINIEKATHI